MAMARDAPSPPHPFEIHMVASAASPEFALLRRTLRRSRAVALDAEWKPRRSRPSSSSSSADPSPSSSSSLFPPVTLLQIACRAVAGEGGGGGSSSPVFIVDLLAVAAEALWEPLRELFESPEVLKLGFRFKQDLVYLSSTFSSHGCDPGFDRVEPFLDVTTIYHHLNSQNMEESFQRRLKAWQLFVRNCWAFLYLSDWSCRPLSEEQILYAAADAYYLLEIFSLFEQKVFTDGKYLASPRGNASTLAAKLDKTIEESKLSNIFENGIDTIDSFESDGNLSIHSMTLPTSYAFDGDCITHVIRKYGEMIVLKDSDKKPRPSRRRGKEQLHTNIKSKEQLLDNSDWQGPPPWDPFVGGDGCPKFLCDVMVEGLAKHLRCVGIDAAIPSSKKPEPRQLLNQAYKEKRVLLTRDVKLLKYQYLIGNQVYKIKSLLKNDQLVEVIETFQLKISEDQLMSRCTKCNGNFIQKPLTIEEAIEASKGFQVIPPCLFNRNLEFWKCTDCSQLYWEGTQYHNAVQKFISVCKLND
uniref:3'-5' exonuclease domain-containing protein n=1 Tax=Ananas comosus var. bracteatus TaxID=296719 RepID=A0A6V7NKC5_ANACO|nr:unnamed protein product [Ananas comosus var. bracteatus]